MYRQEGKLFHENGTYVGDILQDVDGFYKLWLIKPDGYVTEGDLLEMVSILSALNKTWNEEINQYFRKN